MDVDTSAFSPSLFPNLLLYIEGVVWAVLGAQREEIRLVAVQVEVMTTGLHMHSSLPPNVH